jgi:DNA-binding transcriptional LysR family regulator
MVVKMKWQGINEFVEVAECQSFTLSAKALSISVAQVSRQITALEKRLKTKLFHRTTRKVSLTQEGSIFYQHCRSVLDGLDIAEQAIRQLQSTPQGRVKLSVPVTYGEQNILPLINDFVIKHSQIEVSTYLTNSRVDLIDEGFDLAIRTGQLKDSSLVAKKLTMRSTYVCASPQYLAQFGTPYSLSELKKYNCLLGTHDHWRFMEKNKEVHVRVSGNIRCNSGFGLVDAALKGIGIIQLPDYYVKSHLNTGELISLLDNFKTPDEGVWALYPDKRFLAAKTRLLIDYLVERLS